MTQAGVTYVVPPGTIRPKVNTEEKQRCANTLLRKVNKTTTKDGVKTHPTRSQSL